MKEDHHLPTRQPEAQISAEYYLKADLYERIQADRSTFDFLQAGSLDGIWYVDMDKPEEAWLSSRFKEVFGYEEHEVPNKSAWWQENIFAEDLPRTLGNFKSHLEDPTFPYDQIVRYHHKNGSTVWIRCRGICIRNEEGRPIRFLGAHTDVTELVLERQKAEEANNILLHSNELLEQFAYSVSHDLKSPVRGIYGMVHLLEKELGEQSETGKKLFSLIKERTLRLQRYMENLLDYSRIGNQRTKLSRFSLKTMLEELLADLLLPDSQQNVILPELEEVIETYRAPLTQIFSNLLSNALKYAGDNATITVLANLSEQGLEFSVCDNGPGIPTKYHERVFELFTSLKTNTNEGDGVGLAVVKKHIEHQGGSLRLESALGEGTCFHVVWPLQRVKAETTSRLQELLGELPEAT